MECLLSNNKEYMTITVFDNAEMLAEKAARIIIDLVVYKPNAVLCLAGGETPRLTYAHLTALAKSEKINFSGVEFVSLDEWVGIPPSNTGSCYYFLNETVFEILGVQKEKIHFFNSMANNLPAECERINSIISELGGIDLMLVGVGMNGHIGFNEPGIAADLFAHVVDLDITTQQVGQKYFSSNTALSKGISLGMAQFMQSDTVLLLATGSKKAAIIKKALQENISAVIPASYIRAHQNAFVLLDSEAAGLL
jgi:glucosamine-6-phosphate isomerase